MSSRLARFAVAGGMVLLAFPAVATAAPSPKLALTWLETASAAAVPGRLESGAALNGFSLRAASLQGYAFPNEPKGTLPSGASTGSNLDGANEGGVQMAGAVPATPSVPPEHAGALEPDDGLISLSAGGTAALMVAGMALIAFQLRRCMA